ncbi:hypothetical protein MLD38_005863 [Melastoma candidum]|uniref:Uncharacterized protein n=1 Tax=Melastoma candidum TaxID=119954 RepID=A0ACB9RL13_9MYRT|nr:hypothetical protein MLD38_005863 [Melastoma candidum]
MSDQMEMDPGPSHNDREGRGGGGGAESSSSKYKGVRKRKWGKWVSEIRLPNSRERIWLGSYDSAEKAARAFDAAQFCLRGRNARFNFPDDPPNIAGGRNLTPAEIQDAAARFANSAPEPPQAGLAQMAESMSASEGAVVATDMPFFDPGHRNEAGSVCYGSDYGIFPGFDDLHNYFGAGMVVSGSNNGEENNHDGMMVTQDYCLWNF